MSTENAEAIIDVSVAKTYSNARHTLRCRLTQGRVEQGRETQLAKH